MEFDIPKGIYRQIADQIRERIASGEWRAGEKLPSVREMAVNLQVNPNTVARSYQSLVDMQVVANHRGLGYFVAENAEIEILREMRTQFIEDEIPHIFAVMHKVGMGIGELIELYRAGNKEKL